jgi:type IV pilus assembly protein PilY1
LAQDIIDEVAPGEYTDSRIFTSAYMVFDISDPLNPRLLGEMTYDTVSEPNSVDLAYTAAVPAVVPIKTQADGSDWYLILGSGPTDVTGVSSQAPKIGMFPLSKFDTPSTNAFRIPESTNISWDAAGSFELMDNSGQPITNGFVADTVTVDYDLDELFKADVVYFGTVEGDWYNWGGHLFRWVTNENTPAFWNTPAPMIDAKRPVTAAPTIGYDRTFYWVYFGTGRFYDVADKSDNAQEYFFGVKEPINADTGEFTWAYVENVQDNVKNSTANDAGSRELLPVGAIQVEKANDPQFATLNCETGEEGCLPTDLDPAAGTTFTVDTFAKLQDYIVGDCKAGEGCSGTDGWVMELEEIGERNLGQGALLGGLMTFTTYMPYADICKPEGDAFLYGVYYQTGTAYYESVFTTQPNGGTMTGDAGTTVVTSRLSIGRGLAMTPNLHVGRQEGSTAFVQTSTGTIVEIPQPNLPIKNTKSGNLTWRGTCE